MFCSRTQLSQRKQISLSLSLSLSARAHSVGNSNSRRASADTAVKLNGLYASCQWDLNAVKALVASRRLAPVVKGVAEETMDAPSTAPVTPANYLEFCPICFLVRRAVGQQRFCCVGSRLNACCCCVVVVDVLCVQTLHTSSLSLCGRAPLHCALPRRC